ncbi:MAG: hypothetical protein IT423_21660, partial [Pirellulaceae bacterium]|nr:hypothetical protein [Pirellulaceae bacterium]
LGLNDRGSIAEDNLADLVFYQPTADWESTFNVARSVWKSGVEVVRAGEVIGDAPTQSLRAQPRPGVQLSSQWRDTIEQSLSIPVGVLEISEDEFAERMLTGGRSAVGKAEGAST